jgi:predicted PurR-regulated permease PerM
MHDTRFRLAFLLLLVGGITIAFLTMIRAFVLTIVLAAIFAGVCYPAYRRLVVWTGGRSALAAAATLLLALLLVLAPLVIMLGAAASEALRMTETVGPRVAQLVQEPSSLEQQLVALPGYAYVAPYREQILTRASELIGGVSSFLFDALSAGTRATALFVFHLFVLLYAMFFFLTDGPSMLDRVVPYVPLSERDKRRMLDKFVSVTRATLKGTILIGTTQGILSGLAFWAVGIEGPIFWGTVMTVFSIVPGVGGALVWVPAAIVLAVTGALGRALVLAGFCALVVGTVDNIMRPRLVGRDTELHELVIFVSTLGGLLVFGATGFILGPVLAALFVTVWEMFGIAFRAELASAGASDADVPPAAAAVAPAENAGQRQP